MAPGMLPAAASSGPCGASSREAITAAGSPACTLPASDSANQPCR